MHMCSHAQQQRIAAHAHNDWMHVELTFYLSYLDMQPHSGMQRWLTSWIAYDIDGCNSSLGLSISKKLLLGTYSAVSTPNVAAKWSLK